MRKSILQSMREDEDMAFLQEGKEFQDILQEVDGENKNRT